MIALCPGHLACGCKPTQLTALPTPDTNDPNWFEWMYQNDASFHAGYYAAIAKLKGALPEYQAAWDCYAYHFEDAILTLEGKERE